MKKEIIFLLAILLILCTFCACWYSPEKETKQEMTLSAMYDEAVRLGFEGTLNEFIATITGPAGVGIDGVYIGSDYHLFITYTNGTKNDLGSIRPEKGQDGVSVQGSLIDKNGMLTFLLSDGRKIGAGNIRDLIKEEFNSVAGQFIVDLSYEDGMLKFATHSGETFGIDLGTLKGENGKDGINGIDGKDGVSVVGVAYEDGKLIFKLSNGEEITTDLSVSNGNDGKDGLSAYELYCKYYDFDGTEKEWVDKFFGGKVEEFTVLANSFSGKYIFKVKENDIVDLNVAVEVKEGYTFIGWVDSDGNTFDPATPITKNWELTAVYEEDKLPVTSVTLTNEPIIIEGAGILEITVPSYLTLTDLEFTSVTGSVKADLKLSDWSMQLFDYTFGGENTATNCNSVAQYVGNEYVIVVEYRGEGSLSIIPTIII